MSTERDELVTEITQHPWLDKSMFTGKVLDTYTGSCPSCPALTIAGGHNSPAHAGHIADAILAAGYRKPRTVTTTEELDALPEGAPIWGSSHSDQTPGTGSTYRKLESGEWWDFENCYSVPSDDILLPAIVIHEGSAA